MQPTSSLLKRPKVCHHKNRRGPARGHRCSQAWLLNLINAAIVRSQAGEQEGKIPTQTCGSPHSAGVAPNSLGCTAAPRCEWKRQLGQPPTWERHQCQPPQRRQCCTLVQHGLLDTLCSSRQDSGSAAAVSETQLGKLQRPLSGVGGQPLQVQRTGWLDVFQLTCLPAGSPPFRCSKTWVSACL